MALNSTYKSSLSGLQVVLSRFGYYKQKDWAVRESYGDANDDFLTPLSEFDHLTLDTKDSNDLTKVRESLGT